MLIVDSKQLEAFAAENRIWQGIPSVEVSNKGRIFVSFYSGETKEEIGNFSLVIYSDDGEHFSDPIVAAYLDDHRCYDPCLWIDPLGRLWFSWSVCPNDAVYASICNDPDAETLIWSPPFMVGHDVMMNKPIVLSKPKTEPMNRTTVAKHNMVIASTGQYKQETPFGNAATSVIKRFFDIKLRICVLISFYGVPKTPK